MESFWLILLISDEVLSWLIHSLTRLPIFFFFQGISSIALKNSKCIWLEPSLVVSISGAERCLNFQFPRSSAIGRNRFIELLRLLAIQGTITKPFRFNGRPSNAIIHSFFISGLTEVELHLRRRKWRRIHNGISHLQKGIKQPDASRIISLFRKGILIEEEIYSPTGSSLTLPCFLTQSRLTY